MLLAATLILLALQVYNKKTIDLKNVEIVAIKQEQQTTQERLEKVSGQLSHLSLQIELANNSYTALKVKLDAIDKDKIKYTEEVRKIRDASESTKEFLDRKLPDDLKRVLNDAISE